MKFIVSILLLVSSAAFAGGSTINATVPAANSSLQSAPIRANFAAAQNDINNLIEQNFGPTAPTDGLFGQLWINTTSNPNIFTVFDGTDWVEYGSLNTSTHAFTSSSVAWSGVTGTPTTLSGYGITNAVSSVSLMLPSIFNVTGSPVTGTGTFVATFANQAPNLVFASPNGSTGAPSFRALTASDFPSNPTFSTLALNGSITGSSSIGALSYGSLSYADTNLFGSFQTSANSYAQMILQNTNSGTTASTDYVVSNNLGTATTYYVDLGMNSSGFTGSGSLNQPSYGYLTSTSGDLAIGTTTSNNIHFVVNGGATDADEILANGNLVLNNANIQFTGALTGGANAYSACFDSSGNLIKTASANCFSGSGYPGAGIANSTGSAWGTSYSTTGSGTVVALATSPAFSTSIQVGSGSGSLTGMSLGTCSSGTGCLWSTAVGTPTSSNYALSASTGTTSLQSATNIDFFIGATSIALITSSGLAVQSNISGFNYSTGVNGRSIRTGTSSDTLGAGKASTFESANTSSGAFTVTIAAPNGDGERRRICFQNATGTITWSVTTPATATAGLPTTVGAGQCVEMIYNSTAGSPANSAATTWYVY